MGYPVKGQADYLALGDWNVACSMCGRKRKSSQLVKNWQGMYRCPEHDEPRQPQDFVRNVKDIMTVPYALEETGQFVSYAGATFPLTLTGPLFIINLGSNYHVTPLFPTWVTPSTFAWSWASGGSGINLSNASARIPNLSSAVNGSSGVLQCVVTNSLGQTAVATTQVFVGKYYGTMTAGKSGANIGYALGSYGTIAPVLEGNRYSVAQVSINGTTFMLTINATLPLAANYFASLFVGANNLLSVTATYTPTGSGSFWQDTWTWLSVGFTLQMGQSYLVEYY